MPGRPQPLLCELHAHSTWTDGSLSVSQLVDLYGGAGFDVLAVTYHVTRDENAWHPGAGLTSRSYESYLEQVLQEAERAQLSYGLLVVPGLELTFDDPDPRRSAHALAIGLHESVGLEDGLDLSLLRARAPGRSADRGASVHRRGRPQRLENDGALRRGARLGRLCSRPLRALQPTRLLRVGCERTPSGRRDRRLPPARASGHVEDPPPRRQVRGGGRRLPALQPPGLADSDRAVRRPEYSSGVTRRPPGHRACRFAMGMYFRSPEGLPNEPPIRRSGSANLRRIRRLFAPYKLRLSAAF